MHWRSPYSFGRFDTHFSGTSDEKRPVRLLPRRERPGKRREEAGARREVDDDGGMADDDSIDAGRREGAFVVPPRALLLLLALAAEDIEAVDEIIGPGVEKTGKRERDTDGTWLGGGRLVFHLRFCFFFFFFFFFFFSGLQRKNPDSFFRKTLLLFRAHHASLSL